MEKEKNCLNCGAPVTTEVCPYCNGMTGLDSSEVVLEYPVVDCKEVKLSFFTFLFPLLFAIPFCFFGFIFPLLFWLSGFKEFFGVLLGCSLFAVIGVVSLVIAIRSVFRYLLVKIRGKIIEATVYGYIDDNFLINDRPAQTIKLLVNTDDGLKFILYRSGDTRRLYKINSKIKLIGYKNLFLISKDKTYYF